MLTDKAALGIVIPALNEERRLEKTLAVLPGANVVVADGGSMDRTRRIARRFGAKVIDAERGRGPQLAAGAKAAQGDWLLFLHADTVLSGDWSDAVNAFISDPHNATRAAVFRFRLDDAAPQARRIERLAAWRTKVMGLPYGDQGLVISRVFYDALGGFSDLPLMEDVDMVRRIGRARIDLLDAEALTSATRYQRDGYWLRPLRNMVCLGLYFLKVPPRLIERIYR